jgi:hypothetical protein
MQKVVPLPSSLSKNEVVGFSETLNLVEMLPAPAEAEKNISIAIGGNRRVIKCQSLWFDLDHLPLKI